jgi:hypothetical protein
VNFNMPALRPFMLSCCLFWLHCLAGIATAQVREALVIGNADYQGESSLCTTLNDARDINDFLNRIRQQNRIALLYYSGHAVQDSNRSNYLQPVDAQIKRESPIRADGISVNAILEQLDYLPDDSVSLLVPDACRNNPFATATRGTSRGLARLGAPPDLAFVEKDKRGYFKRWPRISMPVSGDLQIETMGADSWEAIIPLAFDIYNAKRRRGIRGISRNTFKVSRQQGQLRFSAHQEKIRQRQRYRE